MTGLPRYNGLKRRCDYCDRDFRKSDLVAAMPMLFEGGSLPYALLFCFDSGGEMRCLRRWRFDYGIKIKMDFVVMEYHGKKKGGGGDTGRFPAYI